MRKLIASSLLFAGAAQAAVIEGRVTRGGEPVPHVAVLLETAEESPPPAMAPLDEVELTFLPKVQVVPVGSQLRVRNIDHEAHTVHGSLAGRTLFNRATVPGGVQALLPLEAPGVVAITCDLHSYMRAWVVVTRSVHHAVTTADGTFRIAGVPAGSARVRLVDPSVRSAAGELGELVSTVEVADQPITLALSLAARAVEAPPAEPPTPPVPAPRPAAPSWFRGLALERSFPSARGWILALSALGIVLGMLAAVGNLRLTRALGWRLFGALLTAVALVFMLGMTFLVGLHPAVAAGLGFGTFIGTVIFAAGSSAPE